jgi:hypothetical protein
MRVAINSSGIATNGTNQSDDLRRLVTPRQLSVIATSPVAGEHFNRFEAQGRVFLSVLVRYLWMPPAVAARSGIGASRSIIDT